MRLRKKAEPRKPLTWRQFWLRLLPVFFVGYLGICAVYFRFFDDHHYRVYPAVSFFAAGVLLGLWIAELFAGENSQSE